MPAAQIEDTETVLDPAAVQGDGTTNEDRGGTIAELDAAEREAAEATAAAAEASRLEALKAVAKTDDEKPDTGIPKPRFNEVNERMKAAEAERDALKEQLKALQKPAVAEPTAQTGPLDLDAKEDEYLNALRAGDGAKAKQVRREINAEIGRQAQTAAMAAIGQRDIEQAMMTVATDAITKYPFLSTQSEHKNDQAIADVVEWREFYVGKGERPDVALKKAVDKIGPMYAEKPAEVKDDPKPDTRAKEALIANAKAAAAQPSALAGVGERASTTRLDVTKMSEEEFDRLPASEKKRLRGDL